MDPQIGIVHAQLASMCPSHGLGHQAEADGYRRVVLENVSRRWSEQPKGLTCRNRGARVPRPWCLVMYPAASMRRKASRIVWRLASYSLQSSDSVGRSLPTEYFSASMSFHIEASISRYRGSAFDRLFIGHDPLMT